MSAAHNSTLVGYRIEAQVLQPLDPDHRLGREAVERYLVSTARVQYFTFRPRVATIPLASTSASFNNTNSWHGANLWRNLSRQGSSRVQPADIRRQ